MDRIDAALQRLEDLERRRAEREERQDEKFERLVDQMHNMTLANTALAGALEKHTAVYERDRDQTKRDIDACHENHRDLKKTVDDLEAWRITIDKSLAEAKGASKLARIFWRIFYVVIGWVISIISFIAMLFSPLMQNWIASNFGGGVTGQ